MACDRDKDFQPSAQGGIDARRAKLEMTRRHPDFSDVEDFEWGGECDADRYDDPCDHPNAEVDIVTGEWWCGRCGRLRAASSAEIAAEIEWMAEYFEGQAGVDGGS